MELSFKIDIANYEDLRYLEDEIIETAARQLINEVMNNRYDNYGKTFREKLKEEVKTILSETMDTEFKNEVRDQVSADLAKRYERTKQYKELKDTYDIESDAVIKSGLKDLVTEMVTAEIKKKFK
jgi:bacterioferritin (cytochrome b1)